jgi:hypothetical protein
MTMLAGHIKVKVGYGERTSHLGHFLTHPLVVSNTWDAHIFTLIPLNYMAITLLSDMGP